MSRLPLRVVLAAMIAGGAWAGWFDLQHIGGRASVLDRAESMFVDLRILAFGPRPSPLDVAIVAIDDETVAAAGGYPLDRSRLAALVRGIGEAGARALAVDLLFVDTTGRTADRDLADALGSLPAVIAGAGMFEGANWPTSRIPGTAGELLPRPVFTDAAVVGLVNIATDAGGTPRHMPLVFMTSTGPMPSFGLQAAGLFAGSTPSLTHEGVRIAGVVRRLDLGWHLPLRYYGPRGTVKTVSGQAVLDGAGTNSSLEGRLVLLGATATAIGDRFSTPFDPVLPGVEVLATGIANLLDGSGLVRTSEIRRIDAGVTLALVAGGIFAVSFLPLAAGSALFLALLFGWLVVITVLFGQGYWLSGALPIAGALPPVIGMVLVRQLFDRRQAGLLAAGQQALGRFQAPALARRIAEDPSFLLTPLEQEAAILFIDLSGFSGASERLGPIKTREFLKAFHTLVVEKSGKNGGLVLDFMGDGAMIGFGIPDAGTSDACHALHTAFSLVNAVRDWIGKSGMQAEIRDVRVGVHCGPIVLSRLGHENQQQIAATGDCVNVASRLMEVAKSHDAAIAASSDLLDAAGEGIADLPAPDALETVAIRGRRKNMRVAMWKAGSCADPALSVSGMS
jgi:adenylate cyclase